MSLCRIHIENFKSIKHVDLSFNQLNVFIGENGAGKTNILEAIDYFYSNLTGTNVRQDVFDINNHFSNQVKIKLFFDLSQFVKISKSQYDSNSGDSNDNKGDDNRYEGYYKKIITIASRAKSPKIGIELSQIKGKQIRWNYKYEDRSVIKSLFPLFHVDTRALDIHKWNYLWDVIGELGKVSNTERKSIESKVKDILLDQGCEASKKLRDIRSIFEKANVSIKYATPKDFARNLSKVFFSGQDIQYGGRYLNYYSTGTNSVKYIELLLESIDEIARAKMKEPIVLLDEPEMSLHPQLIDELSDTICNVSEKLQFYIATHSSRLTKKLITNAGQIALFNIRLSGKYTEICRMRLFPQYSPLSTPRVTDDHVNSYFSRAILFVEGETELELFSNTYLHILFPKLHKIDVYKALSDKPVLNIMHPQETHISIPYLCLIDMDKAVGYDLSAKKYHTKSEYISTDSGEQYQFRNKKINKPYVYHQRKRIDAMVQKLRINYQQPLLSTSDPSHQEFVEAIHEYLLNYNVFALSTTIEGALVNPKSYDFALSFLKSKISDVAYNSFLNVLENSRKAEKMNYLRIVFGGKSDLWQTYKSIKQRKKEVFQSTATIVDNAFIGKKASGWVTSYIYDYFAHILEDEKLTDKTFAKQLEDEQKRTLVVESFKTHFPELLDLMQRICNMI